MSVQINIFHIKKGHLFTSQDNFHAFAINNIKFTINFYCMYEQANLLKVFVAVDQNGQ